MQTYTSWFLVEHVNYRREYRTQYLIFYGIGQGETESISRR